jgi:putative transposase
VQHSGWLQPINRSLGFAGIDDRNGNRSHCATSTGEIPEAKPRIISDNGPQFIARDFKEFIRVAGMTHVRTSPGYPQSNGKLERWHKSLKTECIRPGTPLTKEHARRLIQTYVHHYNTARLHSAIG